MGVGLKMESPDHPGCPTGKEMLARASALLPQFVREFSDAVTMIDIQVRRTVSDRATATESASFVFQARIRWKRR